MPSCSTVEFRQEHGPYSLHHWSIDIACRCVGCYREAGTIPSHGIGSQFQEQCHHCRALLSHSILQRRLMIFIAAHSAVERRSVLGHDTANLIWEVSCNCREDMVPCAATDEKVGHGAMRGVIGSLPSGCPTNHLQLMIIAMTHNVTAGFGQPADHVQMTCCSRPMHGISVVTFFANIDIEAALQQQIYYRQLPAMRRR